MTPRGTDWGLATLVALLAFTGALTAFAGAPSRAWVFTLHGVAGLAVAGLLVWKLRRVWRRARPGAGLLAAAVVALTLVSGIAWSSGADAAPAGFAVLAWHDALGAVLVAAVVAHAAVRAKRPRRRDLADRRQFLIAAGVGAAAYAAARLQRRVGPGTHRRFTGSYERLSFAGNAFPTTSWIADHPRALDRHHYRLAVDGAVDRPLSLPLHDLAGGDELVATLDCTGGFYSTQRWRGVRVAALLDRAGARADHVRVISHTGYRWSFAVEDARDLLLATHVGGEALSHDHGAPVRLVAPGRRGFQWVKWVVRLELHDGPDPGAAASTVWSSLTPEGRGA
ncbi:MAG TPA: molybdopterin-dependent oxidoreductase [Solirubrobacteraceae bacterium]